MSRGQDVHQDQDQDQDQDQGQDVAQGQGVAQDRGQGIANKWKQNDKSQRSNQAA